MFFKPYHTDHRYRTLLKPSFHLRTSDLQIFASAGDAGKLLLTF